jgi:hypothetical protein
MPEKALAVPLCSTEIIEVLCEQFRRRLNQLSPLQGNKEYAAFDVHFEHSIKLYRMGANGGGTRDTLAWGDVKEGEIPDEHICEELVESADYKSGTDVNGVRMEHSLPLTVEVGDGKGGKHRKKVNVKKA